MEGKKDELLYADARVFLHDLIGSVDPLAIENEDERDRARRHRAAERRISQVLETYDRECVKSRVFLPFHEWAMESVMTPEVPKEMKGADDPMVAIALELAGVIRPDICGNLRPETLHPKLIRDDQLEIVRLASSFVRRIALITEQENVIYLFRNKSRVA